MPKISDIIKNYRRRHIAYRPVPLSAGIAMRLRQKAPQATTVEVKVKGEVLKRRA